MLTSRSAANGLLFALFGLGTSALFSNALGGEATWAVSTGLGALLAAGVYEVGRPPRLSGAQAAALEERWDDFRAFADARLARRGRCHARDVAAAYRRASPAFRARAANAGDAPSPEAEAELRAFVAQWHPQAERSSAGFYKNLSVLPEGGEAPARV